MSEIEARLFDARKERAFVRSRLGVQGVSALFVGWWVRWSPLVVLPMRPSGTGEWRGIAPGGAAGFDSARAQNLGLSRMDP